jgi:flavin prenyltransferase
MKIVLAITGASGIQYGTCLLEHLKAYSQDVKTIISNGAKKVAQAQNQLLPNSDYQENDLSAPCASGSNPPDALIICPCSLKTLGEIANGVGSNLISRTAEVCLKERKKLILVLRETPYSLITIKNMEKITLAGGVILPASPGFYHQPKTIQDLIDFICGKIFDQLNIKHNLFKKWGE